VRGKLSSEEGSIEKKLKGHSNVGTDRRVSTIKERSAVLQEARNSTRSDSDLFEGLLKENSKKKKEGF